MLHATCIAASSKTREQATYEALRDAIVSGALDSREPLVGSRLAEQLGVSRLTVGNALKRLAVEGFVRLEPHKEAVVAPVEPEAVRELYLMRAELEALATREATVAITDVEIDAASALNQELRRLWSSPAPDIRAIRVVDRAFHSEVRKAAHLPRLIQLLENLADQGEAYRARIVDRVGLAAPNPEAHDVLLRLLAARDEDQAAAFMRGHVLGGLHAILTALKGDQ